MRNALALSLAGIMLATTCLMAQSKKSEYLFEAFTEATVVYKDGRQFSVNLNYNMVDKRYVFYDRVNPDELKVFEDTRLVSVLRITNRTFRITPKGEAEEILNANPFLSVVYGARLKEAPKRAAYGGTSETTAIQSYKTFKADGVNINLEEDRMLITSTTKTYYTEKDGKRKVIRNAKQFKNLFPGKQAKIDAYIEARQIDFNNPKQVVNLFRYAHSLE